jgi:archaellin
MEYYKKMVILLSIMLVLSITVNAGWGGIKYDKYANHITNNINNTFIKYGLCQGIKQDCLKKELLFISQAEPNIQISVNSIKNYKIINEIITIVITEFEKAQKNGDTDLTIYLSISKNNKRVGFFDSLFQDNDFIRLKLKGEEK